MNKPQKADPFQLFLARILGEKEIHVDDDNTVVVYRYNGYLYISAVFKAD